MTASSLLDMFQLVYYAGIYLDIRQLTFLLILPVTKKFTGESGLLRPIRYAGETPGQCGPRFDRIVRPLEAHRNAQRIRSCKPLSPVYF